MRVMIPILATTYGESVTWKETRMFITLIYNLRLSLTNNHKVRQQFIKIHRLINYSNTTGLLLYCIFYFLSNKC